ncbi:MAG: type I restriction enzyme HsdR N-terminal domain-containing protein [Bacteroidota bacterium]
MTRIQYPSFDFRIKKEDEKEWIFDELRKQWVRLTPEEWVRQNMLQYLLQVKKYPASLIAIEKEISLGELRKRFDILIYRDARPWMIIECKEMNVPLSEATIRQILNYNITIQADYIVITNGTDNHGFLLINGKAEAVLELPDF